MFGAVAVADHDVPGFAADRDDIAFAEPVIALWHGIDALAETSELTPPDVDLLVIPASGAKEDVAFAGPGAIYTWSGNDQVGKGRMTIVDAKLYESIQIQLEFLEPWAATNTTLFTFQPTPDGSITVSWAMEGNNTFLGKAMSLVMDMDEMIGKDFEQGLATIKSLTEKEAKNRLEREAQLKARAEAEAAKAAQGAQSAPTAPAQAGTTTP